MKLSVRDIKDARYEVRGVLLGCRPLPKPVALAPSAWLTVEEAATRYKVHPETVRRWIRAGKIQGKKLWGSNRMGYRIPAGELDRLLRMKAV